MLGYSSMHTRLSTLSTSHFDKGRHLLQFFHLAVQLALYTDNKLKLVTYLSIDALAGSILVTYLSFGVLAGRILVIYLSFDVLAASL